MRAVSLPVGVFAIIVGLASAAVLPGEAGAQPAETGDEADRLFKESAVHYKAGRFERAAELLEKAHALSGDPVLLFNLAKAREGLGDLAGAITAYERYLREAKEIPDRGSIEARIETLRKQIEQWRELQAKAEAERLRAEKAAKERPRRAPSPFPWLVAGLGGAGLIAGGVLGALAKSKESEAADAPVHQDAAALAAEAENLALGANISFGIGGGILLGGVTWGIVDVVLAVRDAEQTEPAPAVSLRVAPLHVEIWGVFD